MHLSSPAVLYKKTSQNQVDNSAYLSVINSVCIFCALLSSFSTSTSTLNMNYFCISRSNAFGEISKSARLSKQLQRLYSIQHRIILADIHFLAKPDACKFPNRVACGKQTLCARPCLAQVKRLISYCLKAVHISLTFGSKMSSVLLLFSDSLICCFGSGYVVMPSA